jgi:hypothetical protein
MVTERMEKPKTVKAKRSSNARMDVAAMAESVVHDEIEPEERRLFPHDFLPPDPQGETRELPEGPVAVSDGDLFDRPAVRIGDETTIECRSPVEARYLAYALRCSGTEVFIPTDEDVISKAVQGYEAYVREMGARLAEVVKERTPNRRVANAVRKEALKLLHLVEDL